MHNGLRDDNICIANPPSEVDASKAAINNLMVNTSETGVHHAFPPVKSHQSDSAQAGELVGPSDVSHCLTDDDHGASYGKISSLLLQPPDVGSSPSRGTTLSAVFSNEGGSETSMFRTMRVQQIASQLEIRAWGFLIKYQRFLSVTSRYEATDSDKIRYGDRLSRFLYSGSWFWLYMLDASNITQIRALVLLKRTTIDIRRSTRLGYSALSQKNT